VALLDAELIPKVVHVLSLFDCDRDARFDNPNVGFRVFVPALTLNLTNQYVDRNADSFTESRGGDEEERIVPHFLHVVRNFELIARDDPLQEIDNLHHVDGDIWC